MSFLSNIFGRRDARARLAPLYAATVAAARDPFWYREGEVPDTVDGRFDMIAAILALVLLRLEAEGERTRTETVLLAEAFIDDMEGNIRQLGTGDLVVGKRIGGMMGALGGRLSAFRGALGDDGMLAQAVARNIFHDAPPSDAALSIVVAALRRIHGGLAALDTSEILDGKVPMP